MAKVLIIDDDKILCGVLSRKIKNIGHEAECAHTLREGVTQAQGNPYDVVFLDVRMPDGNGLDMLPKIQQSPSSPEVIIITGNGEPDGAELAIKSGAWDYVEKPSSIKAMTLPLVRALQYRGKKKDQGPRVALKREGIIGASPAIMAILDLVAQAAGSLASVLITGETGTGKELFAKAIHANSPRASGPFVVVDCAALPETLAESELFGYQKGAFTGAEKNREGLIRQANGGTLFLDEVGELPLSMQKTFLRVLQERRYRNVGGEKEVASDFRLVAATNQNLAEMVEQGRFRKDLYFRLRTFHMELPPLRMRGSDMKELAIYYIHRLCEDYGLGVKGFSPEFLEALGAYSWPGNVRELVNTMESVFVMARTDAVLFPKHLPSDIRIHLARESIKCRNNSRKQDALPAPSVAPASVQTQDQTSSQTSSQTSGQTSSQTSGQTYAQASAPSASFVIPPQAGADCPADEFPTFRIMRQSGLDEIERGYLVRLAELCKGDVPSACARSGLSRARLYELLKKHDISLAR